MFFFSKLGIFLHKFGQVNHVSKQFLASLQRAFLTPFIRAFILEEARFHACLRVVDFIFDDRPRSHETARSYVNGDYGSSLKKTFDLGFSFGHVLKSTVMASPALKRQFLY